MLYIIRVSFRKWTFAPLEGPPSHYKFFVIFQKLGNIKCMQQMACPQTSLDSCVLVYGSQKQHFTFTFTQGLCLVIGIYREVRFRVQGQGLAYTQIYTYVNANENVNAKYHFRLPYLCTDVALLPHHHHHNKNSDTHFCLPW